MKKLYNDCICARGDMKTNKLPIHRGDIAGKELVKPRGLPKNGGARTWLIFQTVGLFLAVAFQAYGQQTNAIVAEKKSLPVTIKQPPPSAFAELKTSHGATYKSVRVLKVEPDSLLVEHSLQGGGIGLVKIKLENLSADLQQRYGYDAQKAAAYRNEQAAMQRQLGQVMQAQQAGMAQEWARVRAREEDNFKGRLEIEKQETQRRQAEAARAEAEAARAQAEAAQAQANAAMSYNIYQLNRNARNNDSYQSAPSTVGNSYEVDSKLNQIQDDVYHIRRMQKWGW